MMFSRRHPFLFFLLCMASLFSIVIIFMGLLIVAGIRSADLNGLMIGDGEHIGIVEITGVIAEADEILEEIQKFRDEPAIKAIVLRINSPGGSVGPSQEIFREIRKTIKVKPVVASMGSVAASGGYYIAAGANKILASPGTITGSIGVILGYTNFRDLLQKIGLSPVVIKSGRYKDLGSPVRQMTEDEEKMLQDFSDQIHRQFIADVAEGRNMKIDVLETVADGRILTGESAKETGLVDQLGNFEDAMEVAGALAGVEGKLIKVYPPDKKRFSFFKLITGGTPTEMIGRMFNTELSAGYLYSPTQIVQEK